MPLCAGLKEKTGGSCLSFEMIVTEPHHARKKKMKKKTKHITHWHDSASRHFPGGNAGWVYSEAPNS